MKEHISRGNGFCTLHASFQNGRFGREAKKSKTSTCEENEMFKADLSSGDQITAVIVCLLGGCISARCLLKKKSLVYDTPGTILSVRSSSLLLTISVLWRQKEEKGGGKKKKGKQVKHPPGWWTHSVVALNPSFRAHQAAGSVTVIPVAALGKTQDHDLFSVPPALVWGAEDMGMLREGIWWFGGSQTIPQTWCGVWFSVWLWG